MITKELWERYRPNNNPFLRYEFLDALFQSGSIGSDSGWIEACTETEDGLLLNFSKSHSYGEYIFDWAWAEAYERYGIPYYPKLTSMVPFTPVTTQHFLMKEFDHQKAKNILKLHDDHFLKSNLSSSHFLFLEPQEIRIFEEAGYLIRESMQYHFFNSNYESFEHFLDHLKRKKAKNIRHERTHPEINITKYTGDALTAKHAKHMYQFYISTIVNKNSFDYLNEEFFKLIFQDMKQNILYVEATLKDLPVAGAIFFYDEQKLYGRYWGSNSYIENLHFELCYYQGIEFAIEKKLSVFEAGAQGEHKIARGFRPVKTYSAHMMKNSAFQDAISNFISAEKKQVQANIDGLSNYLPFL